MNNEKILPYETLHNKLENRNPFEKEYFEYEKVIFISLTTESALVKMSLTELPPNVADNYSYLQKNLSGTFCAGTTTKTLFEHWRLCRKRSSIITTKVLICSSLDVHYLTWPKFVCTVQNLKNVILSQKAMKICFQKFGKIWLDCRQ